MTDVLLRVDHWRLQDGALCRSSYDIYYVVPARVDCQRYLCRRPAKAEA